MNTKITNGAVVHRYWGNNEEGEILAHFQFDTHAKSFAASLMQQGDTQQRIVVTNLYDGSQTSFLASIPA